MTEWVRVEKEGIEASAEKAEAVLRGGGVVVFPAERLYGLAADAMSRQAVEKIFRLKSREAKKPLPVIAGDDGLVFELAAVPDLAQPLIKKFWPGPLTLVLRALAEFPPGVLSEGGWLGIRVPGNELARELSRRLSGPVTATSANRSGQESGESAAAAIEELAGGVDLVLDAGPLPGPPGSTVIQIDGNRIKILRPGIIGREELEQSLRGEKVTWS